MSSVFSRLVLPLLLGATLLTTGCHSAQQVLARQQDSPITTRLPALQLSVDPGPLTATDGALPDDPDKVFAAEMQHNLLAPADSNAVFGYAKLQITEAAVTRKGKGFQAVQLLTLMLPSLFGLPMETYCTRIQADLQIMNAEGTVLGTYSGTGQSRVRVAMYHGYSQTAAPRLADVEALRGALNQIRPQLESAADTLRQQLLSNGPLREVIGAAY